MAEIKEKETSTFGKVLRIAGYVLAGVGLIASGVAISNTPLGKKIDSSLKWAGGKVGLCSRDRENDIHAGEEQQQRR